MYQMSIGDRWKIDAFIRYYSQSNSIKSPVAIASPKRSVYLWFEAFLTCLTDIL